MKLLFSLIFFCSTNFILPIYCGNLFNLRALKYPGTIRMALQKIDFLRYELDAQAQIQKEFLKTAKRVEELFGDEFVNEGHFSLKKFLKRAIEVIVREIHELPDYEIYISSLPKQMAKFVPENIVEEVPLTELKMFAINKVDSYYRLQEYFNNIVTLSDFFDPITYDRITTELNAILEYEKQQISIEGKAKTAPMTVQNAFQHLFKLFLRRIKFAIEEGNMELVKEIKKELEDTTMVRFHFETFILKIETLKMIFDAAIGVVQRIGDLQGQIEFLKPYHEFAKKQKEKATKFKNWTDISKTILPTFKAQLKLEEEIMDEKHHKITKHGHGKEKGNEGKNSAVTENLPNLIMGILCHEAIKKMNLPNNFENWEHLADIKNEKWKEAFKKFTGEDYEPELKKGQLMEAQMLNNVAAVKLLDKYIEDHRLYVGEFQKMAKKAAENELGKKEESVGEQPNI